MAGPSVGDLEHRSSLGSRELACVTRLFLVARKIREGGHRFVRGTTSVLVTALLLHREVRAR
jgi:hypothetical protein